MVWAGLKEQDTYVVRDAVEKDHLLAASLQDWNSHLLHTYRGPCVLA